jgi:hypothetical protein
MPLSHGPRRTVTAGVALSTSISLAIIRTLLISYVVEDQIAKWGMSLRRGDYALQCPQTSRQTQGPTHEETRRRIELP